MGNVYSEARLDEEARALIVGQTAADLQALVDVEYCKELLRAIADLLDSVHFPPHFTFKGHRFAEGVQTRHSMAAYYVKVAQCLSACVRGASPRYLVEGQLLPWTNYRGGGRLFEEEDVGFFFLDRYNLATGVYEQSEPRLSDAPAFHAALRKRADLFAAFSELLAFPPNLEIKVENFRKTLAEYEPSEKWLDVYYEKLLFELTTRRIHSLQKI
jgi:hypothetical protein